MERLKAGFLIVAAVVAASAGAVRAFPGSINIFADPGGGSCLVSDLEPGPIALYLIVWGSSGTTASQFRLATDGGFTGVYVSQAPAPGFLALGEPPVDYAVAYGGCMTGSFLIATVTYFGFGTSSDCSHIEIRAAPTSPLPGEIAAVTCDNQLVATSSHGPAVVNYRHGCPAWCIGATEPSTWGRIKALYR